MGIGTSSSGAVIRRLNPSPRKVAGWIALTSFLYSLGMFGLMLIGCELDDFRGLPGANR